MATLATDLSCSTLVRRDFHPLGWFKRFRYLIFSSPSSELFPTRQRLAPAPASSQSAPRDPRPSRSPVGGCLPLVLGCPLSAPVESDSSWPAVDPAIG